MPIAKIATLIGTFHTLSLVTVAASGLRFNIASASQTILEGLSAVFLAMEIRKGLGASLLRLNRLAWIFGKFLASNFSRRASATGKSENHRINTEMSGLGGLEPPTSPLSVLRSLVLPPEMRAFFRQHGRLRRYPPLRVFLLPDFHIRLHNEDATPGLVLHSSIAATIHAECDF